MSKYLNIPQGNYKVTVQEGGTIVLDPGGLGSVVVTGNLSVQGATTFLETTDSVIEDNIIILNRGETGNGVTRDSGSSGIRIDRGNITDAQWLFDEDITWTDTANLGTVDKGAWVPRDPQGRVLGIQTVSITTPGTSLNLLGQYTGPGGDASPNPGKITVSGTGGNYHLRMTDDDDIPNKKYVDNKVETYFAANVPNRIEAGALGDAITSFKVFDSSVDAGESRAELKIDNVLEQEWKSFYTDLYGIRIEQTDLGTEIKTTSTSENDLILGATGTGSVVIEDNLRLARIGHEGDDALQPDAPTEGVTFYTNNSNAGATGIYFANEDGQRDELISRNRALVYSMLF
jgi:hypothetical protein